MKPCKSLPCYPVPAGSTSNCMALQVPAGSYGATWWTSPGTSTSPAQSLTFGTVPCAVRLSSCAKTMARQNGGRLSHRRSSGISLKPTAKAGNWDKISRSFTAKGKKSAAPGLPRNSPAKTRLSCTSSWRVSCFSEFRALLRTSSPVSSANRQVPARRRA